MYAVNTLAVENPLDIIREEAVSNASVQKRFFVFNKVLNFLIGHLVILIFDVVFTHPFQFVDFKNMVDNLLCVFEDAIGNGNAFLRQTIVCYN